MRRRCSIRLVALLGSPALLVVALGYLTHSSDAGQAGATKAALIAATSYSQDDAGHKNPIVRVRWSLVDGWLPAGGFNVYRDNDVKPLNSAPLIAQTSPLPEAGDRISGRKSRACWPWRATRLTTQRRKSALSLAIRTNEPPAPRTCSRRCSSIASRSWRFTRACLAGMSKTRSCSSGSRRWWPSIRVGFGKSRQ